MGGKRGTPAAGPDEDVSQLLTSIGLEDFPYRELGAAQRLRALSDPRLIDSAAALDPGPRTTPSAQLSLPPSVHHVLVLSLWRRAGCTLVASHLAHVLTQQGRSARWVSAAQAISSDAREPAELELVDASGAAAEALGIGEPELHAELARTAHTLLLVLSCREGEGVVPGLLSVCRVLRDSGAPEPFFVLNHYDPRRAEDRRIFASLSLHCSRALLPWAIAEDPVVPVAQGRGRPVYEDAPESQAAWALHQLCEWLVARHDRGDWAEGAPAEEPGADVGL